MRSRLILTVFISFLAGTFSRAQQYNFHNYNVEDGLAQSQVYSIVQDDRGYLWMGTRGGGISVFNGFDFTTFTEKDGLPGNYINRLFKTREGLIWVATNHGLAFFDGTHFTSVPFPGYPSLSVYDLFETSESTLLCATGHGLFELKNGIAKRLKTANRVQDEPAISSVCRLKGQTWFGTNEGLYSLNAGKVSYWGDSSRYMRNSITVVRTDGKGLWIGTYGDGMYAWNGSDFYRVDLQHELYRQTVLDILVEDQQHLWLSTLNSGVIHYNRNTHTFTRITEQEGLSNNHVRTVFKDNNDNFWFGSSGGGVSHYLGKQFTVYDSRSGLGGDFIYSIFRDSRGALWVGNSQRGVSVMYPDSVRTFDASGGFINDKVKAIVEDRFGRIWLGTDGEGIYLYEKGEFTALQEFRRTYIRQLKTDRHGNVWIATAGNGLMCAKLDGKRMEVRQWGTQNGLLSNRIMALHFDRNAKLWYATEGNGVGCFEREKNIVHLTTAQGLTSPLTRCLTEDDLGNLWIGTAGGGIAAFPLYSKRTPKLRALTTKEGLHSDNIYLLTTDAQGNVIVGSEKGLDYVYIGESGNIRQVRHFGKSDGFSGVETCQNSVWNDANGTIWFGTINGLCRFNPAEQVRNDHPPVLTMTDVKLFYESLKEGVKGPWLEKGRQVRIPKFAYDRNHLTFEFLGVNLRRPAGVLYRWKLKGFDDKWSPPSRERSILYSNLAPGKYTFEVLSANEDNVWNEKPLLFTFEISAPFWQTNWFLFTVIASAVILLLLIFLLLTRRIRRKARARQRQLEMEKEFLELEQKALRLQMNPHFIFNAMNSIQSLIGTGQEKEARYYLAKFSRLMRQILENSRKQVVSLEEEIHTLENYLLVEQFCTGNRFDYQIHTDERLEPDFISIPPMLIQPFVENAIKHGIKGLPEGKKGVIELRFEEKNGLLICTIEDNGIGLKRSEELRKQSKETYHESTGMLVIRERLERFDGLTPGEALQITELYDSGGEPAGTRVTLRIPIA